MPTVRLPIREETLPDLLWLYYDAVLLKRGEPDRRLNFSPSAVPVGEIKCSVLDGDGSLWFADPRGGALQKADLVSGHVEDKGSLTENNPVRALYLSGGTLWALTDGGAYAFPVPALRPIPALGRAPLQKIPYYYASDRDVPESVKAALLRARRFEPDDLLRALGGVRAVAGDNAGGRYVALSEGVVHLSKEPAFDRRKIELYAGGRYVFDNDPSVCAVCADGEGLWIQNRSGFVHIERRRVSLSQKAAHYDRIAWELQSVRGSLCDVYYGTEDFGNGGKLIPLRRYSTNNDALWSVFHAVGEAQRYSVMKREGDARAAADARQKLVRVTENVLLQSHIHGFGNGFTCRGYVSAGDRAFFKDGRLDSGGLWFEKSGRDADGRPVCVCVDTPDAHAGDSPETGRNFLLTDAVKARLNTSADRPADGDFRLTAPITAKIPPRLARLYRQADPYHPDAYPAGGDSAIFFKCDTSSEEVIAAFVQYYFTWKHLISTESGRDTAQLGELIRQTAAATLTHLLDNGYCLRDVHGNPTQWGKWFADYFAEWDDLKTPWRHPDYACLDGPLNGAELMCILRVAMYVLEGSARYRPVYERACRAYDDAYARPYDGVTDGAGYAALLTRYRRLLSKMSRAKYGDDDYVLSVNYSDETLAIIAYWPLIELEKDEGRLRLLRAGLDEWWDNMRREHNPIYTFAYAALNPEKAVDFNGAVDALNRYPMYLRAFPVTNSRRNDVMMIRGGEEAQSNVLLPVDERRLHKANSSPFTIDDVGGGRTGDGIRAGYLYSGNIFTWPYWTARYYDLLDLD